MRGVNLKMTQKTIEVEDLRIVYGEKEAVKGISFEIEPGEVVGILGDNGAGKSSTMRTISTVNPPTSGKVIVAGYDIATPRGAENARQRTGYCPDVGGLIRTATPREHLMLSLTLHNKKDLWDSALNLLEMFDLMRVIDEPTSSFSHGMSRRLSVILAALASKNVLILDEPFDGVDPLGVDTTIDLIHEARNSGVAVMLSTHLQELLVRASDRVIVMARGEIKDQGAADAFKGEEGQQRYLKSIRSVQGQA